MSESRGTINGTFGENGDTPAQTLMGGGEFRSDAHKEITALRQTGARSPFLSALPPGAEDGRGTSPSLRDTLAVSPFDHAVPAAFGGWHRTLNTVSALISSLFGKVTNGLRQQPFELNPFEYAFADFGYVAPTTIAEFIAANDDRVVLHAPNLHGDPRNEIAPEHPKFSATEWKSTSHVRS